MATRFNSRSRSRFGIGGISTGYDGLKNTSSLSLPSCGIEDVDRALFLLFKDEIPLNVSTTDGIRKVPVIVAGGEKWALLKKGNAIRDDNGSLILPLVTIVKQDIVQSMEHDIAGRGSNQHTGELVIKRRLLPQDRGYQALVNKMFLKGQSGVAVGENDDPLDDQVITGRDVGMLIDDPTVRDGGFLVSDLRNNIFEVIVIPTPQYITLKYEVTLWTQQQKQMNEIIESIISSYVPQTRGWKIETAKGYWFVAKVTSDEFTTQDNVDNMSKSERLIKKTFKLEIPAFILVSDAPGSPVPIKRYISNPVVSFGVSVSDDSFDVDSHESTVIEPFLGMDDPTLPLSSTNGARRDARNTQDVRRRVPPTEVNPDDPAFSTMKRGRQKTKWKRVIMQDLAGNRHEKYVRIKSYNSHTGEMILDGNAFDLGGLTIVSIDD